MADFIRDSTIPKGKKPDSCTVLLHFHSNPVLVAVIFCSPAAQTVFNIQKNTFISKPQQFCMALSLQTKQEQKLSAKQINFLPGQFCRCCVCCFPC